MPATEDMALVFSDEFNSPWRDFAPGKDAKWQALDIMYVNGDEAVFRRDAVTVKGGSAIITVSRQKNRAPFSVQWGDQLAPEAQYTSGMLQGWNKFCFAGGYLEARLKLPGPHNKGGLWPAVFTMGNLGRAGYMRSTEGLWPFSYDVCDKSAMEIPGPYSDHNGQRINRCNSTTGRGSPEIDLLEAGIWNIGNSGDYQPRLSTSMQLAPLLPQGMHWLDNDGAMYFPTYSDPLLQSSPNGWDGINSFPKGDKFMPRPGTKLADALSAIHVLNATHYSGFYRYGLDWAPRKYIRWYINDLLIFEMNALAMKGGVNSLNESVGDRLIPVEPSYLNINVAMANSFSAIDPKLPLPAHMEIDYIRVYQSPSEVNIGCDTPEFPSQAYINSRVGDYKLSLEGWEDFVGDSSVMGPTMQPIPPSGMDDPAVRAGVIAAIVVGALLIAAGMVFYFWRRHKHQLAADAEAGLGGGPQEWRGARYWLLRGAYAAWAAVARTVRACWYGSAGETRSMATVAVMPAPQDSRPAAWVSAPTDGSKPQQLALLPKDPYGKGAGAEVVKGARISTSL